MLKHKHLPDVPALAASTDPGMGLQHCYSHHKSLPASETRGFRGMGLVLDYISVDNEMSNSHEGFSFVTISEESVFFMFHKPTRFCEDNKQLPWGIKSKYFQSIGIFTMTAINGKGIAQL